MIVVSSAFSPKMIKYEFAEIIIAKTSVEEIKKIIKNKEIHSIVGHEGTAWLFSQLLGVEIKPNREEFEFKPSDLLIVGMPVGRLPEGHILSLEELQLIPIDWRQIKIV